MQSKIKIYSKRRNLLGNSNFPFSPHLQRWDGIVNGGLNWAQSLKFRAKSSQIISQGLNIKMPT